MPLQQFRVEQFYDRLRTLFIEQTCDCLVDLGDTTDDRSTIPIPTIDAVIAGLAPFPSHPLNLKLVGNHEQWVRDCSVHVGRLFEHKFTVISHTEVIVAGDTAIFCAAFPATDAQLSEWLVKASYDYRDYPVKILMGHFQVVGSRLPSGTAVTGVPAKLLRPFNLCLLGHVHRPQEIAKNAFYVGSPFQQDFGEKGEAKRIAVLDTDTAEVIWMPVEGFPEYRVCNFAEFIRLANKNEEHRYQVYLRSAQEAERFYAHPLMDRAEAIYDYSPDLGRQTPDAAQKAQTTEDILRRYVDLVPPEGFTAEEILEYGLLISKAEN